jgi:hypothetical protein
MSVFRIAILLSGPALLGFQDPAKTPVVSDEAKAFLNQGSWYGTVTIEISGSGIRGSDQFSVDRHASVGFTIASGPEYTGLQQSAQKMMDILNDPKTSPLAKSALESQMGVLKKQANSNHWRVQDPLKPSGTHHASVHDTDRRGTIDTVVDGQPEDRSDLAVNAFLEADMLQGQYTLTVSWPGTVEVTTTTTAKNTPPQKGKQNATPCSFKMEKLPVPKAGEAIHGERVLTKQEVAAFDRRYGTLGGTVVWHLSPTPLPPAELEVAIPEYQSWMPEPALTGDHIGPKPLQVDFRLSGADEIIRLNIHLKDISREPGIAGNAPLASAGIELMGDLVLVADPNLLLNLGRDSGAAVNCGTRFTAHIGARDGGAYGILTAVAFLKSGRIREGKLSVQGQSAVDRIPIPRRTLPSKVADAFKEQYKLKGVDDDADEENDPKSWSAGDGLTLYEEYRGFFEDQKFIRGDPTKKDLFVCNKSKDPGIQDGIDLFQTASGIVVHGKMNEDEMKDNCINFNKASTRKVEQHGVMITGFVPADWVDPTGKHQDLSHKAYTYGPGNGKTNTSPKVYTEIVICEDLKGLPLPKCHHTPLAKPPKTMLAGTVAHEMGHYVGLSHHGDMNGLEDRIWDIKPGAAGAPQRVLENGAPVRVFLEDGTEKVFMNPGDGRKIRVGLKGGFCSGDENCLMRYADAWAYVDPADSNARIYVGEDDMPGSAFCHSARGTGINDPDRLKKEPQVKRGGPRFGDATNGNCMQQMTVSDK